MNSKVALITGGAQGIGLGIASQFYEQSWNVIIVDIQPEPERLRNEFESERYLYIQADITDKQQRNAIQEKTDKKFGRLDCLVNNAGVAPKSRLDLLEATEKSFERVLKINLFGPYFLSQQLANYMIGVQKKETKNYRPSIINISSISAYTSSTFRGEYCISKAGVSMMTTLFADRLAQEGIFVYEIRPGIIETPMTAGVKEKYDKLIGEGLLPIKRWGKPDDIGKAAVTLALGQIPYSTGQVINIDGGFHIRRL